MILRVYVFFICALVIIGSAKAEGFGDETNELLMNIGLLMNEESEDPNYPVYSENHYKQRFLEMSGAINYKLTSEIKAQILYRVNKIRTATERTLGLTEMYFPVFEEYLSKKGMPRHIKYLPIVESNLNPVARSHAAAVGLWQFIPGTGKMYGLKINSYIDERSDTYKATDAATTMLSNLYKRYGDWCLALAAYNCGPGRIDKLVKSKGHSYWAIRKYLPRETQMYVPYFMAVVYTYEYHNLHQLKSRRLSSDLILTDTIHLKSGYKSLSSLAVKYGVTKDLLKRLNPVYFKNYVPSGARQYNLVLPMRVVAKIRGIESKYNRIAAIKTENPIKCIRRVNSEAELQLFMNAHLCNKADVLFWNRLPQHYKIQKNDLIAFRKYFAPKDLKYKSVATRKGIKSIKIHALKVIGLDDKHEKALTLPVYINISKIKKPKKKVIAVPSARISKTKKVSNNIIPAARAKSSTQILQRVSADRTRGRRLRSSKPTPKKVTKERPKMAIPAMKSNANKTVSLSADQEKKSIENIDNLANVLLVKEQKKLTESIEKEEFETLKIIDAETLKIRELARNEKNITLPNRARKRNLR